MQKAKRLKRWAPQQLQEIYRATCTMNASKWIASDDDEWWMSPAGSLKVNRPADFHPIKIIAGVGSLTDAAKVIERLCTDDRMCTVWTRINALLAERREDDSYRCRNDYLSSWIARLCAETIADDTDPVTKAEWVKRHKEIARAARGLAKLLGATGRIHPELQNAKLFFSEEDLLDLAAETYRPGFDDDAGPVTEEMDHANESRFNDGVAEQKIHVEFALSHCRIDTAILKLAERADFYANNAVRVPVNRTQRGIARLQDSLTFHMLRNFDTPAHDIVSTITSVALNQDVSAESVKQRRQRRRSPMKHHSTG
jgi:hypothetical protein